MLRIYNKRVLVMVHNEKVAHLSWLGRLVIKDGHEEWYGTWEHTYKQEGETDRRYGGAGRSSAERPKHEAE